VPEKDGILACLLLAEMRASRGKSLKNQLKDLFSRVGAVYNRRLNVKLDPAISARVKTKIAADVSEFHGRRVVQQNRIDGLKLIFEDGSWVLMRPSGTEPVVGFTQSPRRRGSGSIAGERERMDHKAIMQGVTVRIALSVFGC
jgi:phosphoglucomutase